MKAILYMAITVNGIIAKDDDSSAFITDTEVEGYVNVVKKASALVVGRRTYEILSTQPEFEEFRKAGVKIVAVSHANTLTLKDPSHAIAHSPQEAVDLLKEYEEVVVAGGAKLNASFMVEGLIDEMYLDVEPTVLGKGIPLFNGNDFEKNLTLLGQKMLSENEIQLHYRVEK